MFHWIELNISMGTEALNKKTMEASASTMYVGPMISAIAENGLNSRNLPLETENGIWIGSKKNINIDKNVGFSLLLKPNLLKIKVFFIKLS